MFFRNSFRATSHGSLYHQCPDQSWKVTRSLTQNLFLQLKHWIVRVIWKYCRSLNGTPTLQRRTDGHLEPLTIADYWGAPSVFLKKGSGFSRWESTKTKMFMLPSKHLRYIHSLHYFSISSKNKQNNRYHHYYVSLSHDHHCHYHTIVILIQI